MGKRNDDEEQWVTMRVDSLQRRTGFVGPTTTTSISDISMSSNLTKTMDKSSLSSYLGKKRGSCSHKSLTVLALSLILYVGQVGGDMVYVRSGDFGQLVTSSTTRWAKGTARDALTLKRPGQEGDGDAVCRVYHTILLGVGLVTEGAEGSVCNINTQDGAQGSDKYQTISQSASRLVWMPWKRPNPPPTGAVAVSVKPQKFLAADLNYTTIGYLDPTLHLGSAVFPNQEKPSASCFVLTEIEPERYELSDIQLKRNKGFIEEDIVLAYGKLLYKDPQSEDGNEDVWNPLTNSLDSGEGRKGRIESILSYETNSYDYWGQGYLMAKGLHTTIHLPDGSKKIIEWGIPLTQAGRTETMTAVADLYPGTAINVTLHGTRLNGEMSYWATLKTFFKDGFSSTRVMDNHRKVIEIQDIRLEHSRPYFLANNSIIPEPTTTEAPTTTTTSVPMEDENDLDGGTEGGNALAVGSSPHNVQADQSRHAPKSDGMRSGSNSVALSHFTSASFLLTLSLHLSNTFTSLFSVM